MKASFYIINKFFWKNKLNVFFAILMPVIMVILVSAAFTIKFSAGEVQEGLPTITLLSPVYIIPGTATISIVALTVLSLPLVVHEFKKTNTLKRLEVFRPGTYFFAALIVFYLTLCYISFVVSFIIGSTMISLIDSTSSEAVMYMIANMNYLELLFSIFLYSILAIGIGTLFAMFAKNNETIQVLGVSILLFVMFIGGAGIPLQYAAMYSKTFWAITYLSPYRYPLMLILESCIQGPVLNAGHYNSVSWELFTLGGFAGTSIDEINKLGHSSIFDFKHSFITNYVPIPHLQYATPEIDPATGMPMGYIDTWYPDKCYGVMGISYQSISIITFPTYQLTAALWGVFWSQIDLSSLISQLLPGTKVASIPSFTFATTIDKMVDIIIPPLLICIAWFTILKCYKSKMIQK